MTPAQITDILTENDTLNRQLKCLRDEVADLRDQLMWFKRQTFGSTSERYIADDSGQEVLPLGLTPTEVPAPKERITYDRQKPSRHTPHGREEFPAHLPRERREIMPDVDVSKMSRIGEKVTEKLHYAPPVYRVIQLVRPVFAGNVDGERHVVCAVLPPDCNEKGILGASAIAHAVTAKFEDHLPMYRLRKQILRDCGVDISESVLNRSVETAAFWFEPIARRLDELVMSSEYVQMDESTIRVMIKPTNGKSSTGHMWLRRSPEQKIVVFDFDRHRSGEVARRLIGDYQGILQTDGYVVYDSYSGKPGIVHAGCHGHARRKFDESKANDKARSRYALDIYRDLFEIEVEAKQQGLDPPGRLALRKERSTPLIDKLKAWLDTEVHHVRPKSRIGKAMLYCLGRWSELTRFLEDGRIELSTNGIENDVRPLAVGRKNWLFAGNKDEASRMAIIYTIAQTCKQHSVNLFRYLTAVLEEIPKRMAGDIDDLLPMNWKDPDSKTTS